MKPALTPAQAAQKKQRDIILSVVLLLSFAFLFVKNVVFYKYKPKGAVSSGPAETVDTSPTMSDQLVYVTNLRQYDKMRDDQRNAWKEEWGRDPFVQQEAVSRVVKAVNLTLSGIFWDEKNPKAVVNEKTLFTGDTIYGYTVVEIRPRSVILRTGEKNIELAVFRPVLTDSP